jgi:sugar lactone lactonase YvrE
VTLLREETPSISASTLEAEALIKEARRLRRRRWLIGVAAFLLVVLAGAIVYVVSYSKPTKPSVTTATSQPSRKGAPVAGAIVTPKQPDSLAVGPTGDLYVIDVGRDQILRYLPDGKFQVVAGTGRTGFSGDGGPAIDANLRLGGNAGLVIARNGTVYFSDVGNDRVRAVLHDGDIETVAGGGQHALPASPGERVPARSAPLGGTAGLAFGPNGELYMAASFIVRLSSTGQITWVAGSRTESGPLCYSRGCPVGESHFQGADGLAFDGDGDLVVSSGDLPGAGFALAEVRANGRPIYIGGMRGEGGEPAALAPGPQGSVLCAAQIGLYRIANGSESPTSMPGGGALDAAIG